MEAFWVAQLRGGVRRGVRAHLGGFWAYGPDSEQPPCGTPPPAYSDIAENAFYCPDDDLIAWDNVTLVPGLYDEFGGFTVGIVFAHEFGHAIQERASVRGATVMTELQSDCFAGAWTADVEAGNSDYFDVRLDDLDKAVSGFLTLRDGVGTSAQDPAAHGTGFDRIGAFSEGYEQGLERCAAYPDLFESGELVVVEVPFTDQEDFERGGNLPLADVVDLAITDLEDFWTVLFTEMGTPEPWDPVDAVTLVDPDTDTVTCGEDVRRRGAGGTRPSTAPPTTRSTSTPSTSCPRSTRSATTRWPPSWPASTPTPRRCASGTSTTTWPRTCRPTAWRASTPRAASS